MIFGVLIACIIPYIHATVPDCDGTIQTYPEILTKSGVAFQKVVVNSTAPVEVRFRVQGVNTIKKIKWKLNEGPIDVDQDETSAAVFWMKDNNYVVLVIRQPKQHYIGKWEMTVKYEEGASAQETQACMLTSPPMIHRFLETFRATEGYELVAVCKGASRPSPTSVQWYKVDGTSVSPVMNTNTTEIPGDTLVFPAIKKSDAGVYICNTTGNPFDSAVADVKVKSRFAALWPFIGILAELIILMITIIVYERHKAAKNKKAAESDPLLATPVSPHGDTKSAGTPSENVRV